MNSKTPRTTGAGYAAPRTTAADLLASGAELNRTGTDFLKIDLETLRTLTRSALNSDDAENRSRRRRSARKGYDTILRLIRKVNLTEDDADFLSQNLRQLKSDLQTLGETF